jgi:hypothetical protein
MARSTCCGCGEIFSSEGSFNKHRTGSVTYLCLKTEASTQLLALAPTEPLVVYIPIAGC